MAAPGRPTNPDEPVARPRFRERAPEEYRLPDLNPYLATHRELGRPIVPADEAWTHRGRWAEAFGRQAPLLVEIGAGNGEFVRDLALRWPDWNLVAIELRFKRCVLCARKLRAAGVNNALIVRYDAGYIDDLFADGEASGAWMNHPDPWPKARHEKNRMVSGWMLGEIARFVAPGGFFRLKSDFRPNVERVRQLVERPAEGDPRLPFTVLGEAEDVTRGPAPWPDDLETNFQSKFRRRGLPVHAIELRRV